MQRRKRRATRTGPPLFVPYFLSLFFSPSSLFLLFFSSATRSPDLGLPTCLEREKPFAGLRLGERNSRVSFDTTTKYRDHTTDVLKSNARLRDSVSLTPLLSSSVALGAVDVLTRLLILCPFEIRISDALSHRALVELREDRGVPNAFHPVKLFVRPASEKTFQR